MASVLASGPPRPSAAATPAAAIPVAATATPGIDLEGTKDNASDLLAGLPMLQQQPLFSFRQRHTR